MESIPGTTAVLSSPLDPDAFSYFGFAPMPRDERRRISRLTIRSGPCDVSLVENGILDPGMDEKDGKSPRISGGVYDAAGVPVAAAGTQRKGGKRVGPTDIVSTTNVQPFAEDVIYLGPLFNHYGRVLLETLARAWFLNDPRSGSQRVVVSMANSAQDVLAPWLPRLLEAFGIPPQRLCLVRGASQFRQIAVPEALFEQSHSAHMRMVEPFHHVAEKAAAGHRMSEQPIYLSRGALSSRQRPIVGEAEVERILAANGVCIVYPEALPLADQVRLFNTHRDIFSPVGSAAHTVLFATNRPRLHLIASNDDIPANYFLCSALSGAPTTFINCLTSAGQPGDDAAATVTPERRGLSGRGEDPFSGLQSRPQKIEFEPFVEYLRSLGLLRRAYRPLSATDREQMDDRFDEAWAFARLRKATGKDSALTEEAEEQVRQLSATSWPVSLMMARYFSRQGDAPRTREMVLQFLELVPAEQDEKRLRHFRSDVIGLAQRLKRTVDPDIKRRLQSTVEAHWPSTSDDGEQPT